jgi:hypothetical protein
MFKGLKCELFGRMLQVPAMEIFNYISEDDGSDDSTEASGPTMALQNLG